MSSFEKPRIGTSPSLSVRSVRRAEGKRHILNPHVVPSLFNVVVLTPLGVGRSFGTFVMKDAGQESIGQRVVVRLPVDDVTRPRLKDGNCLTQNAVASALFTFELDEVEV